MLEASDAIVVGAILESLSPEIQSLPFVILSLMALTYLNYRGAYASLTINFIITAIAFLTIIILLFSTRFYSPTFSMIHLANMTNGLPYGVMGIIASLQFGVWFYLGIEGTALAAEECRSTGRSLPMGTLAGMATLLIGATITWYVCSGLIDATQLGSSVYPLYDAALATNMPFVILALFVGTIFACLASANGCINDASRAWFAMSRDTLIPSFFSAVHPKYKTPYRAIVFLLPISVAFGFTGLLDQTVTFSILSAVMAYIFTAIMMIKFRKMYPMDSIKRGYVSPWHPIPAIIVLLLSCATLVGMYLGYWINILGGLVFYILASVWFVTHRAKHVSTEKFIQAGSVHWPRPKGY